MKAMKCAKCGANDEWDQEKGECAACGSKVSPSVDGKPRVSAKDLSTVAMFEKKK